MTLDEILEEHGKRIKASLKLNANGICAIKVKNEYILFLQKAAEEGFFFLYAPVATVPEQNALAIFTKALTANFFGRGTGEAFFSYDDKANTLILCQRFEEEQTTFSRYEKLFNAFASHLIKWSQMMNDPAYLERADEGQDESV